MRKRENEDMSQRLWGRTLWLTLLVVPAHAAKYLLLTTQRSGSTWFCDVLHRQPGIECGVTKVTNQAREGNPTRISEMMIHYSFMKHSVVRGYDYSNITWARWQADCEAQFAWLSQEASRREEGATIGFKLMYDQVPPRLRDAFVNYVVQENIVIIHLERMAVLLNIASRFQTIHGHAHERDGTSAAQSRESTEPLAAPFAIVARMMKSLIAEHDEWKARLRFAPGVRYFHAAYEHLIGPAAGNYLRSVVAFLADPNQDVDLRNLSLSSELFALHKTSCCERVAPSLYAQLRDSFGARSTAMGACGMLDEQSRACQPFTTVFE